MANWYVVYVLCAIRTWTISASFDLFVVLIDFISFSLSHFTFLSSSFDFDFLFHLDQIVIVFRIYKNYNISARENYIIIRNIVYYFYIK